MNTFSNKKEIVTLILVLSQLCKCITKQKFTKWHWQVKMNMFLLLIIADHIFFYPIDACATFAEPHFQAVTVNSD